VLNFKKLLNYVFLHLIIGICFSDFSWDMSTYHLSNLSSFCLAPWQGRSGAKGIELGRVQLNNEKKSLVVRGL